MRPASHDPFSLPVRILALGGLAGLAALTLADPGATRMFATPWTCVLAFVLVVPALVILLRAAAPAQPLRLPPAGWLIVAFAAAAVPLASALASPYRAPSLYAAAVPVSAAILFLLLHDWLAAAAEHRARLEKILTLGAGVVTLVSLVLWLVGVSDLTRAEFFSAAIFEGRNPHPLGHANYTAGLMLLGLPWLVLAAWRQRGPGRLLAGVVALLALFNLILSGSRGGLLGLAALGVAAAAGAQLGWKRFGSLAAVALVLAAALAAANPRIRGLLRPADPAAAPSLSTVQRAAMVQAGGLMGRDRPLLGYGPGTVPLAYPRYRQALDGGTENALQLHNTPAQLAAETGGAGLLVALGLAVLVAGHWRRAPAAAATLAGYAVFALADYQLDVPFFAASLAALAALLVPPVVASASPRVRWLVAGATVIALGLIAGLGGRDRAPALNTEALALARDPAQHDRAVALLRQSLTLNPNQEIAHFNLGWLLVVSDPARAEGHFLAAATLVPDKGGVYFGLGLARLNQGRNQAAAQAFALECVNEPLFLASPWWNVPALAAQRDATAAEFRRLLAPTSPAVTGTGPWVERQAALLLTLAPRLGQVSPGPEKDYRRERVGYPVLMRNADLPVPADLYDVREDPRFPASVPFPLPSKGWLPSPRLLKLLDESR